MKIGFNLYSIPLIITSLLLLTLGFLVYFKQKQKLTNLLFFVVCLSSSIWLFFSFLAYNAFSYKQAYFLFKFSYVGIIFIAFTYFHYVTAFLKLEKKLRKIIIFGYLIGIISVFLLLNSDYIISGIYYYFWGPYPKRGYLHPFFLLFFFAYIIQANSLLIFNLLNKKQHTANQQRMQIFYSLFGALIFTFASIDFIANYGFKIYPFGYGPTLLFISIIGYAIAKYRLMDIRIAITRASIFVFVYTLVLGIPFWIGFRIIGFEDKRWVIIAVSMFVLATPGPLIYRYLQKRAEDILLAKQRHYQKLLIQAGKGMVREYNLNRLLKFIVYIIKRIARIKFVGIFLIDKSSNQYLLKTRRGKIDFLEHIKFPFEHGLIKLLEHKKNALLYQDFTPVLGDNLRNSVQLIVPAFNDNNLVGFLLLGEKEDDTFYTEDDIEVFEILSRHAALAIEHCVFLEEFQNAQEKVFQAEKLASIGGMADGVAHQIKNRLNLFSIACGDLKIETDDFIEKHTQLVEQNPELKATFNHFVEIANSLVDNVRRTNEIVKGILNFARTEAKETYFSYFSLNEIIETSLGLLKVKHEIVDVPLEADIESPGLIFGVKAQIMECIYNILDNCYEAVKEKMDTHLSEDEKRTFKPLITLKLTQNENCTHIVISDNGIGIRDESKYKIFAPFYTTKSSFKSGTGIGMYVVKRMIEENHNGKIRFESKYMEGVTFYIELPKKGVECTKESVIQV